MTVSQSPEQVIAQVKRLVESDKRSEIRLNANGGNSILIVCPPKQELDFINAMNTSFEQTSYQIIDLNKLLIDFVKNNKEMLVESFDLLRGSIHQIFKIPEGEIGNDLFSSIFEVLKDSFDNHKIPVLIHSGALYGTGIDNIHLMENELVMKSKFPIIILYPATQDGDKLLFLSQRSASKYRCMIIH